MEISEYITHVILLVSAISDSTATLFTLIILIKDLTINISEPSS